MHLRTALTINSKQYWVRCGQLTSIRYHHLMIVALVTLVVMLNYASSAPMYAAQRRVSHRFQELPSLETVDEDDMDQTASSPSRNRGRSEGQTGASDGFEENESDGPYGETPREEEGQADLEKFFDDHLGASERDGMDKENLPSNLASVAVLNEPRGEEEEVAEVRSNSPASLSLKGASSFFEPRLNSEEEQQDAVHLLDRSASLPGGQTVTSAAAKAYEQSLASEPMASTYLMPDRVHTNEIMYQLETTSSNSRGLNSASNSKSKGGINSLSIADSMQGYASPEIHTSYVQLPGKKIIVTRRVLDTRDAVSKDNAGEVYAVGLSGRAFSLTNNYDRDNGIQASIIRSIAPVSIKQPNRSLDGLDSNVARNDVVVTENEDDDQIYVTNNTNQPFRIYQLGGYDPEEDFRQASRDFEEPAKLNGGAGSRDPMKRDGHNQRLYSHKDINFNDSDSDLIFNDASETDEVTFNRDNPNQNDQEVEPDGRPEHSETDKVNADSQDKDGSKSGEDDLQDRNDQDSDDSDSKWVNDGVDDMEVPSQAHQNSVLEKAAKMEAMQKGKSDEDAEQRNDPNENANEQEDEGERMPNADYLKDDLNSEDMDAR